MACKTCNPNTALSSVVGRKKALPSKTTTAKVTDFVEDNKTAVYAGAAVLAGGLIYYFTKKKK